MRGPDAIFDWLPPRLTGLLTADLFGGGGSWRCRGSSPAAILCTAPLADAAILNPAMPDAAISGALRCSHSPIC